MGQMYPRKPFSSFAHLGSTDPDAVLRDVRMPTMPPPLRAATEKGPSTKTASATAPVEDTAIFPRIRGEVTALGDRLTGSLHDHPLATIGTTLGIGIALGAIFGTRIGRLALFIGAGSLLHRFVPSMDIAKIEDTARRSGA